MINLQSGRPYSRQIYLPTARNPASIMEPASDEQRHPFQYMWDIGIGKQFNLGGSAALQLDLQILNVLNNSATDSFETVRLNAGDTFIPSYWVKPRRLQVHVGIEF